MASSKAAANAVNAPCDAPSVATSSNQKHANAVQQCMQTEKSEKMSDDQWNSVKGICSSEIQDVLISTTDKTKKSKKSKKLKSPVDLELRCSRVRQFALFESWRSRWPRHGGWKLFKMFIDGLQGTVHALLVWYFVSSKAVFKASEKNSKLQNSVS